MWDDFKTAYSNKYLLKWSVWWAFATCGNLQVGNYIQPLWESDLPVSGGDHLYNGAVEATQTLLSELLWCCDWWCFGPYSQTLWLSTMNVLQIFNGVHLKCIGFVHRA